MDTDECYSILGVSSEASHAEIKRAFRKLALRYSPDRHPGNEAAVAKYRRIVAAYQTLSDPEERQRRGIEAAQEKPRVRGFKSFKDVFTALGEPEKVRCEIGITAKEARRGCERTIRFMRFDVCEACHGEGGETPCKDCGGAGKIWKEVEVRLRAPPGIQDGALLRLPGEGDLREERGRRGDVYCRIRVQ